MWASGRGAHLPLRPRTLRTFSSSSSLPQNRLSSVNTWSRANSSLEIEGSFYLVLLLLFLSIIKHGHLTSNQSPPTSTLIGRSLLTLQSKAWSVPGLPQAQGSSNEFTPNVRWLSSNHMEVNPWFLSIDPSPGSLTQGCPITQKWTRITTHCRSALCQHHLPFSLSQPHLPSSLPWKLTLACITGIKWQVISFCQCNKNRKLCTKHKDREMGVQIGLFLEGKATSIAGREWRTARLLIWHQALLVEAEIPVSRKIEQPHLQMGR
jgi:hypothetical protein